MYSTGSGVKRVHVVLSGLRMRLLVCLHVSMYVFPVGIIGCLLLLSLCRCVLMSSAYVVSFTGACGVGVSDVYMLKIVCDRTPPCGTPVLNWRCVDVLFLNMVYTSRPLI